MSDKPLTPEPHDSPEAIAADHGGPCHEHCYIAPCCPKCERERVEHIERILAYGQQERGDQRRKTEAHLYETACESFEDLRPAEDLREAFGGDLVAAVVHEIWKRDPRVGKVEEETFGEVALRAQAYRHALESIYCLAGEGPDLVECGGVTFGGLVGAILEEVRRGLRVL